MRRPLDLPAWPDPDPYVDPVPMALARELGERDPGEVTVAGVAERAGVSVAEFETRFSSLGACVLDSIDRIAAAFEHRVGAVFNAYPDWQTGLRAAAHECADWIEENPELAEFGAVKVLGFASEMARVRREELFIFCAGMIDRGREEVDDPTSVPEPAAIMAVGSIIELLAQRLKEGAMPDLHKECSELTYGVVRLYLGDEAAEQELTIGRPPKP